MTFVFTYSGFRVPLHLYQSVRFCRLSNPDANILLISNPELRISKKLKKICQIYVVEEKIFLDYQRILNETYHDQIHSQNGFWFKSIERFLYISEWIATSSIKIDNFIHLESDCLSFINQEIYSLLSEKFDKIAVPVDIEGNCIPSVVFFPNSQTAMDFSDHIKKRILSKANLPTFYCNDIHMLNEFRLLNKVVPLPSLPLEINDDSTKVVFDSKHIGEYLFGKDIRHNNFVQKSGYIAIERDTQKLVKMKFYLKGETQKQVNIRVLNEGLDLQLANLHNFSKRHDLFDTRSSFKKLQKTINNVNKRSFHGTLRLNHFFYFLFDKAEYNFRVKWKNNK